MSFNVEIVGGKDGRGVAIKQDSVREPYLLSDQNTVHQMTG